MQDSSYATLLQIPDAEDDLITFQELRPVKHGSFDQNYETTFYDSSCLQNPCSSGFYETDITDTSQPFDVAELQEEEKNISCGSRKRKASIKQNHSEIEKRRRDKMNTYITELSSMIPMCSSLSRKVDKITVLRMAVEYLKSIRGPAHSYTETHYKPPYITDQELKHLILQVAEGFLFVVGCDRGKILYISESVSKVLYFSKNDLLRQSLFDILHPKDVAIVKEQLSSSEHNPREKFISSRISRLCPGARRSFFCRMKRNLAAQMQAKANVSTDEKGEENRVTERKYAVIHCTGYLKSWHPTKIGVDEQDNDIDSDSFNVSCLIAVGRIMNHITSTPTASQQRINTEPIQFISKHTLDGKFLFVDQRVTLVLGFLPQELLGCSMYEYFHPEDIPVLAETHKTVLQTMDKFFTKPYRFKTRDGVYVDIQSEWRAFKNPWTKEIEYLISKNNLVIDWERVEMDGSRTGVENFDFINERNQLPTPENTDDGIIKLMEDVTRKPPNIKQQSDGNDEAAMAIIMSLLEVDAGLGGPVDFSGLPWPLP